MTLQMAPRETLDQLVLTLTELQVQHNLRYDASVDAGRDYRSEAGKNLQMQAIATLRRAQENREMLRENGLLVNRRVSDLLHDVLTRAHQRGLGLLKAHAQPMAD